MASITRAEAVKLCDAAIAQAAKMNIKVSVSVVDSGTNLVTMQRMDGAVLLSVGISEGKAVTSVLFGVPSADTVARNDNPAMRAAQIQTGGRFVMAQGALPIKKGGELIGAIGVSGATSQEDEDCARAAIQAAGLG